MYDELDNDLKVINFKMKESSEEKVSRIFIDIRTQIIYGQLKPHSKLTETKIADQYNASRLHVKSAFRMLLAEDLVYHEELKGFFVKDIGEDYFGEIIAIRQALEEIVIKMVIKNATSENIETMQRIGKRVKVFIENDMIEDGLREVKEFYDYLYTLCSYKRVVSILSNYSGYFVQLDEKSASTIDQHRFYQKNLEALINAIAARDTNKAISSIQQRHKYLLINRQHIEDLS